MKKNILTIFKILFLTCFPGVIFGQTFSDKEVTEKVFPVTPQTTIEVNNKYGKVHVVPWRKDSVKFVIDLNVTSNSLSKLHKIKNSIRFDFTSSIYYVTAITDFGSAGNQIVTELRNLSESLLPGKNNIEVNYRVYCPESVNLTIINKFGDIYIDDLRGEINISLSNGDMKVNSISGEAQIELNFGSGIINQISDANISTSYSDLNIKRSEKLQIVSKSSTLHIDDADMIKVDSKRDKLFFAEVYALRGSTNFSQIWLEQLKCEVDLDMKFGDLTIDKLETDFCNVDIRSNYADINLYLQKQTQYKADIYYHKDAYLDLPADEKTLDLTTVNKSEEELHSFYKTGTGENLSPIKIQALEKCYINLIYK